MELLIPGLILVALMVYASTRIKRSAARAFEAETVEEGDFVIQKPEGFLNVIGGDPQYAFEAYSKDFGGEGAEDIRQGTATLAIYENISDAEAVLAASADETEKTGEIVEVIDGLKYRVIEAKRIENGVSLRVMTKAAERNGKVYVLRVTTLSGVNPEIERKADAMLDSFMLK